MSVISLALDLDWGQFYPKTMSEEMPSTITISSTATGATGVGTEDGVETESGDNVNTESMELMSRDGVVDKNDEEESRAFVVPAARNMPSGDDMSDEPPIPTETEALYATVSMMSSRQKTQFPSVVPTGCLVDPGMVMSRVSECAKLLEEDDATSVMLNHATGLADNLTTFVSSVKGVMAHLKVCYVTEILNLFKC